MMMVAMVMNVDIDDDLKDLKSDDEGDKGDE